MVHWRKRDDFSTLASAALVQVAERLPEDSSGRRSATLVTSEDQIFQSGGVGQAKKHHAAQPPDSDKDPLWKGVRALDHTEPSLSEITSLRQASSCCQEPGDCSLKPRLPGTRDKRSNQPA